MRVQAIQFSTAQLRDTMELLTNNTDLEISTEEKSPRVKSKKLNGFNKKIYIHSPSGTVIIGWIRKIFYTGWRHQLKPFVDSNWRKIDGNAVPDKKYDIHLYNGEILFSSVYRSDNFVVEFDFLQRVIAEEEVRWIRESE